MERAKKAYKLNLFEKQMLFHANSMITFICILVPTISVINIYYAFSSRYLASAALTLQLNAFAFILFAFRKPLKESTQIFILRHLFRFQLFIFAIFLLYVIGINHQIEITPWVFIYILLLSIVVPTIAGGIICMASILLMIGLFLFSPPGLLGADIDYLIRFCICMILFCILSYLSVFSRSRYLKNLQLTKDKLKLSGQSYRALSDTLLAEIKHRDKIEKQLHHAIKMETLGKLSAGVAHDLNNILSGMVTYPDLLLVDIKKSDPLRKPLELIRKSGIKAAAIVDDLLTLSGQGFNVNQRVNLESMLMDYLSSPEHEKLIENHPDICIETRFSSTTKIILGSPVHLTKAILNLITNSIEAMPHGGAVSIGLRDRTKQDIKFPREFTDDRAVVLSIADTGTGIPREDIKNIFEPFYTTKKMGRSGTGLGMTVVMSTMKDHSAHIGIDSTPGIGTTISIFFPIPLKSGTAKK